MDTLRKSLNILPGPWGLPLVGYLPFLGLHHITFFKLAANYGPLVSLNLGNQRVILLCDYNLLKKALLRVEFTGRPSTPLMHTLDGLGIINSEGMLWKKQRRFLHVTLTNFGMRIGRQGAASDNLERRIKIEVDELILLLRLESSAVDASPFFALSVANVICGVIMSVRFKLGDARFERLNYLIEEGMRLFGELNFGEYIPLYNYLPGKAKTLKKLAQNREEMFEFYQPLIEEHRRTLDMGNARDCIDSYLIEMENAKINGTTDDLYEGKDHEMQLKQILSDLFSASTDSVRSSLLWKMVYMLRNPAVKQRVQEEIDAVVGRNRLPALADMPNLPYTQATIYECLRMASVVPLATTHTVTTDVQLDEYLIPAGTHVVPLLTYVHMDPKLWDEPETFNPTRFFDETGEVKMPPYLMPFGVGRRMCLGNTLARKEMFMIFASLMHQFDLQMEEGEAPPSLESVVGATVAPKPFRMRFVLRSIAEAHADSHVL